MGYRIYGEPKDTKESPLTEFLGGFFMGGIGFPITMGWALPAWGIASWPTTLAIGIAFGLYIGGDLGWSSIKRKRAKGALCKKTKR